MSNTILVAPSGDRTHPTAQHAETPEPPHDRFRFGIVAWTGVFVILAVGLAVLVGQIRSDTGSGLDVSVESTYTPLDPYQEVQKALAARSTYTPVDPYREIQKARPAEPTAGSTYTPVDPYQEIQKATATS